MNSARYGNEPSGTTVRLVSVGRETLTQYSPSLNTEDKASRL